MSTQAFGVKFVVVNDVQQQLTNPNIQGGPWVHHGTIKRGFKEYVVLRHGHTNKIYLEEVDPTEPGLFKRIEDDKEWADLYRFAEAAGLLYINPQEIKAGKGGLPGFNPLLPK